MGEKNLQKQEVRKVSGGGIPSIEKKECSFTNHNGMKVNVKEKQNTVTGRIIRTRIIEK